MKKSKTASPKGVEKEKIPRVIDYADTTIEAPRVDVLGEIATLAQKQIRLEDELEELQVSFDAKKKELEDVRISLLPELLLSVNMKSLTTGTGLQVEVGEKVFCSIPKARHTEAISWLDENGLERIVRRSFEIVFPKEETKWAGQFRRSLERRKRKLNVREEQTVHAQTLKAQVKRILEEGVLDIPFDLFGIFKRDEAVVTRPKTPSTQGADHGKTQK